MTAAGSQVCAEMVGPVSINAAKIVLEAHCGCRIEELLALVLDECSFLTSTMLGQVHRRLQILLDCDAPWGGIVVVLAGDNFQLPPPRRPPMYKQLVERALGTLEEPDPLSTSHLGLELFERLKRSKLTKLVRARDAVLVSILNRMRETTAESPVPAELAQHIKVLTEVDCLDDARWITDAPCCVISHL